MDNLKQAGIELKPQNLESNAYFDKLFTGNFDLAYGSLNTSPGPNPYYELRNTLDSATTAALGPRRRVTTAGTTTPPSTRCSTSSARPPTPRSSTT